MTRCASISVSSSDCFWYLLMVAEDFLVLCQIANGHAKGSCSATYYGKKYMEDKEETNREHFSSS